MENLKECALVSFNQQIQMKFTDLVQITYTCQTQPNYPIHSRKMSQSYIHILLVQIPRQMNYIVQTLGALNYSYVCKEGSSIATYLASKMHVLLLYQLWCMNWICSQEYTACNYGFSTTVLTFCAIDVDECTSRMPCDVNAMCTNSEGSFSCVCNPGYVGNGKTCNLFSKSLCWACIQNNTLQLITLFYRWW